jgi:hypothetical protein
LVIKIISIDLLYKTTKHETINKRHNHNHYHFLDSIIHRKLYQMVKQENRGRKPIAPELKKINVQLFVQQYQIDKLGGIKKTKLKLLNYINEKTIRNPKLEA